MIFEPLPIFISKTVKKESLFSQRLFVYAYYLAVSVMVSSVEPAAK